MTEKVQLVKMKAGSFRLPVVIRPEKGHLYFNFPFNRALMDEIKVMKGSRWHGFDDVKPVKEWSVKDCERNQFQIAFLRGLDPYAHYDKELLNVTPSRSILYEHQIHMFRHGITRRQCILACEMRTGKTLAAIEIMEWSNYSDWLWVGPKSSIPEIQLQFDRWEAKIIPRFITYDRLRKEVQEKTISIPDGVIFDESTKVKNPTAQRSQAAATLAEAMREANSDCFIIEMSGAPAPKSPGDWWHQCEVVCPGFLREGDLAKFKKRLCLVKERESFTGGTYPELITWFDDERKCKECGKLRDEHYSLEDGGDLVSTSHPFEPSVNEVAHLYKRMNGLVLVYFRKDCLDLPETQFRIIRVDPSESVKRAANLILKTSSRAVTALMLLRELSDGFQYREEENGTETCELCKGSGTSLEWYDPNDSEGDTDSQEAVMSGRLLQREEPCSKCKGSKVQKKFTRVAKEVPCPKEQVLIDLLEEHEPANRFVVYAGFQASVDRCVRVAQRYQWDVIRIDGRGWVYYSASTTANLPITKKEMLLRFQDKKNTDKITVVGQPGAAGMGLTLTASPSVFFYSNSYDAEHRIQASERVQGLGMDLNRGATVIDVVHLSSDQRILDNLEKKLDLLHLTMGKLRDTLLEENDEPRRQ